MPELASERFVVHAGERNSSSAPKVQEKPLTLSSFSQEPPMLFCYLQEFQSLFLSSRQPQGGREGSSENFPILHWRYVSREACRPDYSCIHSIWFVYNH